MAARLSCSDKDFGQMFNRVIKKASIMTHYVESLASNL